MTLKAAVRDEARQLMEEMVITIRIPISALPQIHSSISALAANLDHLRVEAGWSFDDLYKATGISKKLSIGHIRHNKGITPHNLRAYVDAFQKALKCKLTVQDLTGPD